MPRRWRVGKATATNHPKIIRSSAPECPRNCRSYFNLPLLLDFSSVYTHTYILTMSAPGAGHEFPAKAVSWQKRDVLLFANSIGIKADELHFLYVRHLFGL